jgi:excisionase family DNA binding protein
MAQKFSSLEEAASQLGISKERLSELREAGKVRGYRDGASWKFRSDDIERLSAEGIPTLDAPPSDIDLGSGLSLDLDIADVKGKPAASSGIDLDLPADQSAAAPASDLNLDEIDEPTVPAATPDDESEGVLSLGDDDELLNLSDSILLSEKNLGAAGTRPPSTIIGKAELDPDGDLDLTLRDSGSTAMSDVKLAGTTSDVLVSGDDESLDLEPPSLSDNFQGLAEVDVDLEAESSRILSPGDAAKAKKGAAKAQAAPPPSSELQLAPSDSDAARASSDIGLGGSEISVGAGLTGLSALELEGDSDADSEVLGEGSDITLSSESSGINIISPSDSGLALDEVALSSASMSSPLDLGADEATLEPLELSDDAVEEEPFQLTPLGEAEDEEKDSSQIIALDDIAEEETAGVVFQADEAEGAVVGDDFGAVGLTPGMVPVTTMAADDVAMSGWVFGVLTCGVLLLLVSGMMMFDLVRNIWSWEHGVSRPLNSELLEVVNPFLK